MLISLADKGKKAFRRHEEFHLQMVQAMRQGLDDEQCRVLMQAMKNLRTHFEAL